MIKLFITLNLLLALVISLYLVSVTSLAQSILQPIKESHYQKVGQGTLKLLNRAVEGVSVTEREAIIEELQQQFIYPLALESKDAQAFTPHQLSRLEQGLIVQLEHDHADYLYGYLPNTDLMWAVAFDQTYIADEENTVAGSLYLLRKELEQYPASQQLAALERVKGFFGIEVNLRLRDELALDATQMAKVNRGEILVVFKNDDDEQIYQALSNSPWVIHIGSIHLPWLAKYLNLIVLGILLLMLGLVTLIWVGTLWRELSKIRQAAKHFGDGDYHTRVPYKKYSRLAQLSHAFNVMAEQTQNSIRSHKELTSAVSHELRTPVARMRFSLDMLADSDNEHDRERYIANMNVDMEELDSLLHELLTYARLDQGGNVVNVQDELLDEWLLNTMQSLKPLSGSVVLNWECDSQLHGAVARFDAVLMNRLLSNLVQNAIRHANTQVLVQLSALGEQIILCVDDDGVGIPEQERERLFEAFATQDSSRNKATQGFGLGLAIVKRIIQAHQGQVSIESAPMGGARLCVRWQGLVSP